MSSADSITIDDPAQFAEAVAQVVIDRIKERNGVNGLVNLVVQRIIELQRDQTEAFTKASIQEDY